MKFLDIPKLSGVFSGAKRPDKVKERSAWEIRRKMEDQLFYDAKPARLTLIPNPAPQGADKELLRFFERTECLQPYFNAMLGGYWSFDELPGHHVSLGTYDGPDVGRTFQIQYNAGLVGELSVVPLIFPRGDDWAELRLRLQYPIELINSERVHGFLCLLAKSVLNSIDAAAQNGRAEQMASIAMVNALWDARVTEGSSLVVSMSLSGAWGLYQESLDHWRNHGVDPWERLEPMRDDH